MDIWLDVAPNEMHYVASIIPTLKWRGGKLGVRLALLPKDVSNLFNEYREAYSSARTTEHARVEKSSFNLFPKDLCEFLDRKLTTYFSIKAFILDPSHFEDAPVQPTSFEAECLTDNPLKDIVRVDMIDAQRGFADPDSSEGTEKVRKQLSAQMRNYYEKHLDPEKAPSPEDLDILEATEGARQVFDKTLALKFAPAIKELEGLGYPGISDPKLTTMDKIKEVTEELLDDHVDDHVDEEIQRCFLKEDPKCFFVFAGAGSGKTRSLIKTLTFLDETLGDWLLTNRKQIAVITYTNAACDEISRRLHYKSIFSVSTIHSFLWELIKNYQSDIKAWVINSINLEIAELEEKQRKSKTGKTSEKRAEDIRKKQERLAKINTVRRFTYNPNGDNVGYDSLNHSEVVKMGSKFICAEDTMQNILISQYPILLIDESQDTKKELVDAIFTVCERHKGKFIVGMFGDTMQRIYQDGKENLSQCIPDDWVKPQKIMNHRSASRIVTLANAIRFTVDTQQQRPRSDAEVGNVRLFIVSSDANKEVTEQRVAEIMSEETGDGEWRDSKQYKSLILEHHMAASRFGFLELYLPLNEVPVFNTSLRDGSISELSFLSKVISPLVQAYKGNNDFEVLKIVKEYSPLMESKKWISLDDQTKALQQVESAVDKLMELWKDDAIPTCLDVLRSIQDTGLFKLDERVDNILSSPAADESIRITALRKALSVPFTTLEKYFAYVSDNTRFATHQGVKGLEFPRVMVIIDDAEAKGFLFSYEKLFGVKLKTETDIKNEREGKDNSITRTTRLFYVACTRAQKSLAIIAYTYDCEAVKATAMKNNWFEDDEIRLLE